MHVLAQAMCGSLPGTYLSWCQHSFQVPNGWNILGAYLCPTACSTIRGRRDRQAKLLLDKVGVGAMDFMVWAPYVKKYDCSDFHFAAWIM
jgi:hypothetical protein